MEKEIPQEPHEIAAEELPRRRRSRRTILLISAALVFLVLVAVSRATVTFRQISRDTSQASFFVFDPEPKFQPSRYPDRVTFLLLGIRGEGDPEGGLLTDSVILISIEKKTGDTLLVSLPRDLWVRMPGKPREDKLNAAYALGFDESGPSTALEYARVVAERVTGIQIDYTASVDLTLVRDLVDTLGGLPLTLQKPFMEDKQWVRGGDMGTSSAFVIQQDHWVFALPAGKQVLDGNTVLYYVRARYSSDDFDRERRQQEVLLALRDRVLALGTLLNPVKVDELLKVFEHHVVTDIPLTKVPELVALLVKAQHVRRAPLTTGPDGLLEAKFINGLYALVPKSGDYRGIRKFIQGEVAKNTPVSLPPAASPAAKHP